MPERRRFPRSRLRSALEFTGADPRNVTFGFALDVSMGGAFVQTAFPARSGSGVLLRLWRPGWASELLLHGIVRRSCPGGMGVEFAPIGARERGLIDELVEEALPAAM